MASEPLIVRRVLGVDLRATTEIFLNLARAYGRDANEEQMRSVLRALLEDSNRTLVLGAYHEGLPGFQHGKMVGVLMMHILPSLASGGEAGWIEELYVRPDYRRQGLGKRLLEQALVWADGRGLRNVDVEVGEKHDRTASEALYGKSDFVGVQRTRLTRSRTQ